MLSSEFDGQFMAGMQGLVQEIPPNWSHATLLYAGMILHCLNIIMSVYVTFSFDRDWSHRNSYLLGKATAVVVWQASNTVGRG